MTIDGRRHQRAGPDEGRARAVTSGARPSPPGLPRAQLPLESGLGFRLSRLTRTLRSEWARQLAEVGLTPPEAAVLRGIAGRPGCSLRALARILGAEPMTAKRCVDGLEGRVLLESAHRGEDRRPRALELTSEGRALAERVDALVRLQEERLGAVLGPDRRARLEEALGALETDLGLRPADRPPAATGTGGTGPTTLAASRARPARTRRPTAMTKEQR